MKCIVCGRGMKEGVTLIRLNEKGVTGIWACSEHTDKPMGDVARIIHDDEQRRRNL
jgi:hypothetical protein